jgi:HlyD family secretion protein
MSCESDITTGVRRDVLVIPIQALTAREVEVDAEGKYVPPGPDEKKPAVAPVAAAASPPPAKKELQGVFLVGADAKAHFRPVRTGIYGEMDVEILEGVSLGEEVVVGPLQALRTLEEDADVTVDRDRPYRRAARKGLETEDEE